VRKILVLLAGVISAAGLISGGGVAAADNLTVQGCYDNAKPYATVIGHKHYPRGYPDGAWLTTTANCADINVTSAIGRLIRVCFDPSSGPPTCQANYTLVTSQWTVVATNVANGTKFKLNFKNEYNTTGSYAA
jgi:hypothetical protein